MTPEKAIFPVQRCTFLGLIDSDALLLVVVVEGISLSSAGKTATRSIIHRLSRAISNYSIRNCPRAMCFKRETRKMLGFFKEVITQANNMFMLLPKKKKNVCMRLIRV